MFTERKQFLEKIITAITFMVVLVVLPILTYAQTITFTSNNPTTLPSNFAIPSTNQIIYQGEFEFDVFNNNGAGLKTVTFTPTGTFETTDIDNYKFYWNTLNSLSGASFKTTTSILSSGNQVSIKIYNEWFPDETTYYFWITADITTNATEGHNIAVEALDIDDFDFNKGSKIGAMYDGNVHTFGASLPLIVPNTSPLNGFYYSEGYGPSEYQSYTVSGSNLTNNILITAPLHYEVSTSSNSGYSSSITLNSGSGTVSPTTIYVRLKAGLLTGSYNAESIQHSSNGATTQTVSCSGYVNCYTPKPIVTSPILLCLNQTPTPLNATGQNLAWLDYGSSSVGGNTDPTSHKNFQVSQHDYYLYFQVNTSATSVEIHSFDWGIPKNQSVTNVSFAIQHANGASITNGDQTNGPVSASANNYLKQTATFSELILTPGSYRIALTTGEGRITYFNNPSYPQNESSGTVTITGNDSFQLFYNIQYFYQFETSIAPTPSTDVEGTFFYYVTQTISGCTSEPATIEVIVSTDGPPPPGSINGNTTLCPGATNATYSIDPVSGATSYTWTVPAGWSITSGQGTTGITVTSVSTSGDISVVAENDCGTSDPSTLAVSTEDNEDPVITCPANQTVDANNTACSYIVDNDDWNATATDNCVVASITHNYNGGGNSLNGESFPLGTTTITWTARDGGGLESTCDFDITVTNPISATVSRFSLNNECPELFKNQGFNSNSGNYDAGSTKIVFTVEIENANTSEWSFNYELTGATIRPGLSGLGIDSYYEDSEETITVNGNNSTNLTFYVNNVPPIQLEPTLEITNITDGNGCTATDAAPLSITIKAMPEVGEYE